MQSKGEMKREYRRTIRRLKKLEKKETVAEAKFNRLSSRGVYELDSIIVYII